MTAHKFSKQQKRKTVTPDGVTVFLVEEGGFEPPKSVTTDLQSAPFGRSGTPPYELGAGGRIRTPDLLITNQLLYRLSYTSKYISNSRIYFNRYPPFCQHIFQKFFYFLGGIRFVPFSAPLKSPSRTLLYSVRSGNHSR